MNLISATQETELQTGEERVGLGYCLVALGQEMRAEQISACPRTPPSEGWPYRLHPASFQRAALPLSRAQWLVIHSDSSWPGLQGLWALPGAHSASPGVCLLYITMQAREAPPSACRLLEQCPQPHWLLISRSDASFPLFPVKVPSLLSSKQQGRTFDKSANLRSFVRLHYC